MKPLPGQLRLPGIPSGPTHDDIAALVRHKLIGFELRQKRREEKRRRRAERKRNGGGGKPVIERQEGLFV